MTNSTQILADGVILENLPNTLFRVKLTSGELGERVILGHLSGKMRINYIRLLPGDKVKCEINTLDVDKCRIRSKIK